MKSCGPVPGPAHSGRCARPAPVQLRERSASPDGVSVERMPSARRTSRTTAMTNTMARGCLLLAAAILLLSGCAGPTTTGPAPVPPAQPAPSLPADLPLDADRSDVVSSTRLAATGPVPHESRGGARLAGEICEGLVVSGTEGSRTGEGRSTDGGAHPHPPRGTAHRMSSRGPRNEALPMSLAADGSSGDSGVADPRSRWFRWCERLEERSNA